MALRTVFAALLTSLLAVPFAAKADDAAKEGSTTVYELRTYTTNPGKLDDLHKRFRDHTMQLFEKHGIKNIGYWVPINKPNTLVYLIAHKSRAAADTSWSEFRADPEWKQVAKDSERNGKIVVKVVSQYLTPTDYSQLK